MLLDYMRVACLMATQILCKYPAHIDLLQLSSQSPCLRPPSRSHSHNIHHHRAAFAGWLCCCDSFTLLLPLLQSAASTQRAAAGARLAAEQCPRDMNSAFRSTHVKRPTSSMIEWRLHAPKRRRGGTIGWPLLCSSQHRNRDKT